MGFYDVQHGAGGLRLRETELLTSAWYLFSMSLSYFFAKAQNDAKGASKLTGGGGNQGAPGGGAGLS